MIKNFFSFHQSSSRNRLLKIKYFGLRQNEWLSLNGSSNQNEIKNIILNIHKIKKQGQYV